MCASGLLRVCPGLPWDLAAIYGQWPAMIHSLTSLPTTCEAAGFRGLLRHRAIILAVSEVRLQ